MIKLFSQLSSFQRSLISAVIAFCFYGTWAYAVNFSHGMDAAAKAAWVQGTYSFALTFGMTIMIEVLFRFLSTRIQSPNTTSYLSILFSCAIIFSASWWVHTLAGTPEIFKTVILGYVLGGIYTIIYVWGLAQAVKPNN